MRIAKPFLKLPICFDADRLAAEVRALPASAWVPHPGNYAGNDAVLLVSPEGTMSNGFTGQMAPTEHLGACPYIADVMGELGAVWGRSRLMGLAAGAVVPRHVDAHYHWRTHIRIHIPVITSPKVIFTCADESVHMKPGECWVFDSFHMHSVENGGTEKRVHLVLDTVGGEVLWDLIDQATNPGRGGSAPGRGVRPLRFERVESGTIMTAWEVRAHIDYLRGRAHEPTTLAAFRRLDRFAEGWAAAWAEHADSASGLPAYRQLLLDLYRELESSGEGKLQLSNEVPIIHALNELIFKVAVPPLPARPQGNPVAAGQRLAS